MHRSTLPWLKFRWLKFRWLKNSGFWTISSVQEDLTYEGVAAEAVVFQAAESRRSNALTPMK